MRARGFLVEPPADALRQLEKAVEPSWASPKVADLSGWLWSSIDNDDSRDLDQIEYAKKEKNGTRVYVGVADVDWFVPQNSPLDRAAQTNTTSVYTGVETFPMLPEPLSTGLSSLNEEGKRLAVVIEMLVSNGGDPGAILESSIYPAVVQNKAQLTYNAVAGWLEGNPIEDGTPTLQKINKSVELQDQLRMQDEAASLLRERRHEAAPSRSIQRK